MFATYVHDLNPVIFRINDAIALRWYGLAYLAGFIAGAWLLERMSRRKLWVLPPGSAGDFIASAAIFGVFIGGRLGYMFYYWPQQHGWSWLWQEPWVVFQVWKGGMASHGGVLGLVIFTWFYSRKKQVSWTGLGDGLCVVAPLGLMFGRIANFINGELYGRTAEGVAWAMKFPGAFLDRKLPEYEFYLTALQDAREIDPEFAKKSMGLSPEGAYEPLLAAIRRNPEVARAVEPYLMPRHPSQLYEAMLEGALLFAILWIVRVRYPRAPHGLLTGLFFIGYAVFRIIAEQFREPDAATVGSLTSGQFLSLFMILGGAAFLVTALRKGQRTEAEISGGS